MSFENTPVFSSSPEIVTQPNDNPIQCPATAPIPDQQGDPVVPYSAPPVDETAADKEPGPNSAILSPECSQHQASPFVRQTVLAISAEEAAKPVVDTDALSEKIGSFVERNNQGVEIMLDAANAYQDFVAPAEDGIVSAEKLETSLGESETPSPHPEAADKLTAKEVINMSNEDLAALGDSELSEAGSAIKAELNEVQKQINGYLQDLKAWGVLDDNDIANLTPDLLVEKLSELETKLPGDIAHQLQIKMAERFQQIEDETRNPLEDISLPKAEESAVKVCFGLAQQMEYFSEEIKEVLGQIEGMIWVITTLDKWAYKSSGRKMDAKGLIFADNTHGISGYDLTVEGVEISIALDEQFFFTDGFNIDEEDIQTDVLIPWVEVQNPQKLISVRVVNTLLALRPFIGKDVSLLELHSSLDRRFKDAFKDRQKALEEQMKAESMEAESMEADASAPDASAPDASAPDEANES